MGFTIGINGTLELEYFELNREPVNEQTEKIINDGLQNDKYAVDLANNTIVDYETLVVLYTFSFSTGHELEYDFFVETEDEDED